MSNEEHPDPRYGGWEPTPQSGEYDADATAFVQLPPEDLDGVPLAAPGHGYVPPMILPLTPAAGPDPAATSSWVVQTQDRQETGAEGHAQEAVPGAVHWPDPNGQGGGYAQPYQDGPHSTAQWNFTEALGEQTGAAGAADRAGQGQAEHAGPGDYPGAGGHVGPDGYADHSGPAGHTGHPDHTGQISQISHTDYAAHQEHAGHSAPTEPTAPSSPTGHTGQWTIPVADGDLPDESGEFLASAAASQQWYADDARPATLPGGAPAPWATQPQPESHPEEQAAPHPLSGTAPEADVEADAEPAPGPASEAAAELEAEPEAEAPAADEPATEPTPPAASPATPSATPEPGITPESAPEPAAADGQTEDAAPAPEDPAGAAAAAGQDPAPEAEPEPDPSHDIAHDPVAAPLDVPSEHPAASYVLHVNGVDRPVSDAWIGESLLYVLRERLGLAGAKDGCSQGECGACNVQVDGRLVASCLVPAATAAGSEVRTVEGLAVDGEPSDVQRALAACGAVQCGFCIPGMAMTVHDLLEGNHAPSELETRQALCGNLCRCSGYRGVLDAVADVVASREATAEVAATAQTATAQDEPRVPHQAEPGAGGVQQQPHPHEGGAQ
ncbi:2Fe-2S iron-sulfur cluster-binding protein [Streptomyces bacillaris]|uniref:2Fe-2S iron-sulfur cluster-binding protein n=1 Tax=Streptomyces bacillaris TaxID=68179 RepID=UPI0037FD3116